MIVCLFTERAGDGEFRQGETRRRGRAVFSEGKDERHPQLPVQDRQACGD